MSNPKNPLLQAVAETNVAMFNRMVQTRDGRSQMICDLVERHRDYLCIELAMLEQLLLAEETGGPDTLSSYTPEMRAIAEKIAGKPFSEILSSALAGREEALNDLREIIALRKAKETIASLENKLQDFRAALNLKGPTHEEEIQDARAIYRAYYNS